MKLLLHICCAPCLIYPLESLKSKNFEVTGFFYNPNIHPLSEYNNRRQAVEYLNKTIDIEIIYPEYIPSEFFWAVNPALPIPESSSTLRKGGVNLKEEKPERCFICWSLRLKDTARAAKENGFNLFSTTLLISPYQDQDMLKKIGSDISKEEGIDFYYEDFRPGFRKAHEQAKSQGIYCQKYCGCIYSNEARTYGTK